MKKLIFGGVLGAMLLGGSMALAFWEHHPHLEAAHHKIDEAVAELERANDGHKQFGGHRERAEQLLRDAQREIHDAAVFADTHH
jgi:C4-dicarboxylate-specific signal transduction histidine kinase